MNHKTIPALLVGVILSVPSGALAGNFTAFGPENYTRSTGSPVTVTKNFTVLNPSTSYTLRINNGGLTDGQFEAVSSSVISLNGAQIVGPSEFNQNVKVIEKPVSLAAGNQLSVELRGKPGGGITVQIIGVDNDPPTIGASVSPGSNNAGWHKTDATVTFNCVDGTSGIAVCSPPVIVTNEGTNQVISGTAVDRAGNSATTSVTLNIDKTPPAVTISSPANGATVGSSPVTVTGTITEIVSGIASIGCNGVPATLSGSTFTCDVPLNDGANTITVDATDVASNLETAATSVSLVVVAVRITSPSPGDVVDGFSVLVRGTIDVPPGAEIGVSINGTSAFVTSNNFAAEVLLDPTATSLEVVVKNAVGAILGSDRIPIVTEPPIINKPTVAFRPSPNIGSAPLKVTFTVGHPEITRIELDLEGDGIVDFEGPRLFGHSFDYANPGLYFPTIKATYMSGETRTASALLQVLDLAQLDTLLQAKWTGMKDALRNGDIATALTYIGTRNRSGYERMLNALTIPLSDIGQILTDIRLLGQLGPRVEYEMLRMDEGRRFSFVVYFILDEDGVWRVDFF